MNRKLNNTVAEENLKKVKIIFRVVLKTVFRKISVDPKILQLKHDTQNNQKGRASEDF